MRKVVEGCEKGGTSDGMCGIVTEQIMAEQG